MKRLCLYLTYDKQNIVDRYIGYMLKELKTCADELVVICNEEEIYRGMDILERHANRIYMRKNVGYDAGGFQDALCSLIGWEEVLRFDELVLVNDSFFGPFKPMKNIFERMSGRMVDFWGLTKNAEKVRFPEHIQSFFITIRSNMLHSAAFKEYWENMPVYHSHNEVVDKHEILFTEHFAKLGFRYDCFADVGANDSEKKENNFNQYAYLPHEMIKSRNFPFFKKRQMTLTELEKQTQESQFLAIRYIDKDTDYDVDMIWENLIRTMDMCDLYRSLHLHYILPECRSSDMPGGKKNLAKITVILVVSHKRSSVYIREYLDNLSGDYQYIICALNRDILEGYAGYSCILMDNSESCWRILDKAASSEYVCVMHDVDITGDIRPSYVGKSLFYNKWENLLKNDAHIFEVIQLFEENKWLGFLAPPLPFFHEYFRNIGEDWGDLYGAVKKQAERMKLKSTIQYQKRSFAISDSFWIRGSILRKLKAYKDTEIDMELLRYMWIYIVQDAGFYSGIVESSNYAGMNMVNLQYCLNVLGDQVRRQLGNFSVFPEFCGMLLSSALENFCNRNQKLYIYGAGELAKKYRKMIPQIEAYIVSDGEPKEKEIDGEQVIYLSEVGNRKDIGIIVCLNAKNQEQVIPLLREKGFTNFICI